MWETVGHRIFSHTLNWHPFKKVWTPLLQSLSKEKQTNQLAYLHPGPVWTSTPQEGTLRALWCDQKSASPPSSWQHLSSCTQARQTIKLRIILIPFLKFLCMHISHAGVPDDATLVHLLSNAVHHKDNVCGFRWGVLWCCLFHVSSMETRPAAGGWGHERDHYYTAVCYVFGHFSNDY